MVVDRDAAALNDVGLRSAGECAPMAYGVCELRYAAPDQSIVGIIFQKLPWYGREGGVLARLPVTPTSKT